jgi:hypothetical protein
MSPVNKGAHKLSQVIKVADNESVKEYWIERPQHTSIVVRPDATMLNVVPRR